MSGKGTAQLRLKGPRERPKWPLFRGGNDEATVFLPAAKPRRSMHHHFEVWQHG